MASLIDRLFKREEPPRGWAVAKALAQPTSRQLPDPWDAMYESGAAITPPYDPLRLLMLAETNEVHAAALHVVATDVAGRGWYFEATNDEADSDVRDAAAKALEDLNPHLTWSELIYQAAWELRAVGWAAWEVVRGEDGRIGAVYPVPAHTLRLTRDPDIFVQHRAGRFRYFKRFGLDAAIDGRTGRAVDETDDPASEIIYFARYSPRTRYGVPDWIACAAAIAEYNAIRDYSLSWFESSGTVGRSIIVKAASRAEAEQYVSQITAELTNAIGRYHSTVVLGIPNNVDLEVERLSPDVQEGSFLRRREDLIKAILMAHSVPPYRVGWAVLGSLGGSAAQEMLQAYRHGVVEALQTVLEDRLNKTLFGQQGLDLTSKGWRWRLEDLDTQETETDLKVAVQGVDNAILTPNDARRLLGYEPGEDPALDTFYMKGQPIAEPTAKTVEGILKDLRDALAVVNEHGAPRAQDDVVGEAEAPLGA